jgi:3-dehydroquinate synthase
MQINSFNSKIFIETTVGSGLTDALEALAPSRIFVVTDENSRLYCFPHIEELLAGQKVHETVIGQGEGSKTLDTAKQLWDSFHSHSADRSALVLALGGGMLLDVAGFAAATFKRGMPVINIPTTLLSMVDASVGGKTGINFYGYKNQIGVFSAPHQVMIYPAFLKSLDRRHLYAGWAEMLKHGLVQSRRHFIRLVMSQPEQVPSGEMAHLIRDSVDIKNFFVTSDPYEGGLRKALNLGHTIGHALESLALERGETLLHGEAVAYGLLCEYGLSVHRLGADAAIYSQLVDYIGRWYEPFRLTSDEWPVLRRYLHQDKKNVNNGINFTLLQDVGQPLVDQYVEWEAIEVVLDQVFSQPRDRVE